MTGPDLHWVDGCYRADVPGGWARLWVGRTSSIVVQRHDDEPSDNLTLHFTREADARRYLAAVVEGMRRRAARSTADGA